MNLPFIPLSGLPQDWMRWLQNTLQQHLRIHKGVTGRRTMTTAERDAVDAINGDGVYNSTTAKNEFYENGAWVSCPVNQSATYTLSNVTTDRAYDANATSVDELADVLGTLIADLKASGLIQ